MNYILINRKNIVIDIVHEPRYIKLQTNGYVVACPEKEGTGIVGSDCDTHYPLIRTDTTSSPNAVKVIEREKIPSGLTPNLYKLDIETNEFVYRYSLKETQDMKQEQNKVLFAKYLADHPLTWSDGKEYGITMEDQLEISLNLNQYQSAIQAGIESTPKLQWHAKHEENVDWTFNDLVNLQNEITKAVNQIYKICQNYKTMIYAATTHEEVAAIDLLYGDESENLL